MRDEKRIQEMIQTGRDFMKLTHEDYAEAAEMGYLSDQDQKLPQPPLYKAPVSEEIIPLPDDYRSLELNTDFLSILYRRKSNRVYTAQPLTLQELSFLLWATQGVKSIRGRSYATIRTVACGGARHPFETYLAVRNVEGLEPGQYHYLPQSHSLERLPGNAAEAEVISESLHNQKWGTKAAVVFYYSYVAYRAEWRYGIHAHRVSLIDLGHVSENLYLACAGLPDVGACAIAAVLTDSADSIFGLDGNEEYILLSACVGHVNPDNKRDEDAFYDFVREQGL